MPHVTSSVTCSIVILFTGLIGFASIVMHYFIAYVYNSALYITVNMVYLNAILTSRAQLNCCVIMLLEIQ